MSSNQELEALRKDFNKAIDAMKGANDYRDKSTQIVHELVLLTVVPYLLDKLVHPLSAIKGDAILRARQECQKFDGDDATKNVHAASAQLCRLVEEVNPLIVAESVSVGFECAVARKTKDDLHSVTTKHLHDEAYEIGYKAVTSSSYAKSHKVVTSS